MKEYPVVDFLVRHGAPVAAAIAILPVLVGVGAALAGAHWSFAPIGLALGAITYLIMKSYTELVAIIADMLLPK